MCALGAVGLGSYVDSLTEPAPDGTPPGSRRRLRADEGSPSAQRRWFGIAVQRFGQVSALSPFLLDVTIGYAALRL